MLSPERGPQRSPDLLEEEPAGPVPLPSTSAGRAPAALTPATIVALQRTSGNHAVASLLVARQPGPAQQQEEDVVPDWARTSSADPLPGEPAPGYETPREHYTEIDRARLKELLARRDKENHDNVSGFLGSYSGALVELWGKHVSAEMEKAAEESGWGLGWDIFKFVLTESIGAIVTGGTSLLWRRALAAAVGKAVEFVVDQATDAAEQAVADEEVAGKRAELDAVTEQLANHIRGLTGSVMAELGGGTSYGTWLGEAPLYDLGRFRLPPRFVPVPDDQIKAAVAGAIMAALTKKSYAPTSGDEGTITMELATAQPPQVRVVKAPRLEAPTGKLAKAMNGKPIRLLPRAPLHIELHGGRHVPPLPATDWEKADVEAVLDNYPNRGSSTITRNHEGKVSVVGGSLSEDLYLVRRAGFDVDLQRMIGEIREEQYQDDQRAHEAEPDAEGASSPARGGRELATEVWSRLYQHREHGARRLIEESVVHLPVSAKAG